MTYRELVVAHRAVHREMMYSGVLQGVGHISAALKENQSLKTLDLGWEGLPHAVRCSYGIGTDFPHGMQYSILSISLA